MTCLLLLPQLAASLASKSGPGSSLPPPWVPGQLRLLLVLEEPQALCCICWCHLHPLPPTPGLAHMA